MIIPPPDTAPLDRADPANWPGMRARRAELAEWAACGPAALSSDRIATFRLAHFRMLDSVTAELLTLPYPPAERSAPVRRDRAAELVVAGACESTGPHWRGPHDRDRLTPRSPRSP